jgi:hypothetical protein
MTDQEVINHPDAYLFETISHGGVDAIVSGLREGDPDEELIVVVDDSHHKFAKIYILAKEDVDVILAKEDVEVIPIQLPGNPEHFYQNVGGRCEDAPCCGCCNI